MLIRTSTSFFPVFGSELFTNCSRPHLAADRVFAEQRWLKRADGVLVRATRCCQHTSRYVAISAIGRPKLLGLWNPSHCAIVACTSERRARPLRGAIAPGASDRIASISSTPSARNRYKVRLRYAGFFS